jgi:hypothetical protein
MLNIRFATLNGTGCLHLDILLWNVCLTKLLDSHVCANNMKCNKYERMSVVIIINNIETEGRDAEESKLSQQIL